MDCTASAPPIIVANGEIVTPCSGDGVTPILYQPVVESAKNHALSSPEECQVTYAVVGFQGATCKRFPILNPTSEGPDEISKTLNVESDAKNPMLDPKT